MPREHLSTEGDARRVVLEGPLYLGLIHAHLALVVLGLAPAWTLPLLLPIWMARLMIGRHELLHLRHEDELDPLTRLWPVLLRITPLSPGYREFAALHVRHHQHMATPRDPDFYQFRDGPLRGLLHCMTSPGQTLVRWIAEHGLDAAPARDVLLRAAGFCAIAAFAGPVFLWYWVPLRVTYGLAIYLFSYVLHRRGAAPGVFALQLPPLAARLFALVAGHTGWIAVCDHDSHHANARGSPRRLIEVRRLRATR